MPLLFKRITFNKLKKKRKGKIAQIKKKLPKKKKRWYKRNHNEDGYFRWWAEVLAGGNFV